MKHKKLPNFCKVNFDLVEYFHRDPVPETGIGPKLLLSLISTGETDCTETTKKCANTTQNAAHTYWHMSTVVCEWRH